MKVLTIQQPWADLIVLGFKRVEFRSWTTDYRGPLVIHAAQKVDKSAVEHVTRLLNKPWTMSHYVGDEQRELMRRYLAYPRRGCALAVVTMVSIEESEEYEQEPGYSPEIWAWVLDNVRVLKREIPMRGQLGLFTVKGELLDQIQRAAFGASKDIKLTLTVQDKPVKVAKPLEAVGSSRTLETAARAGTLDEAKERGTVDGEPRRYVQKGLFKVPE